MTNIRLSDEGWGKIRAFLRQEPHAYLGRDETSCRRFLDAVKWMSRSGAQWRLLPAKYGVWKGVYKRFVRWCHLGVWERLLAALAADPNTEHGMLDATIVRAHPWAASAQKHGEQALGRSRGGFSCKLHLTVDGLGQARVALLTRAPTLTRTLSRISLQRPLDRRRDRPQDVQLNAQQRTRPQHHSSSLLRPGDPGVWSPD